MKYLRFAHFLVLLPAALLCLTGCEDLGINYGKTASCKDAIPYTDIFTADHAAIQSLSFTQTELFGRARVSISRDFSDVCPGDSVSILFEAKWNNSCPKPVFFGVSVSSDSDIIGDIPIAWSEQGDMSLVTGENVVIAPKGTYTDDFNYSVTISFEKEAELNMNIALVRQFLENLKVTFTYSKI